MVGIVTAKSAKATEYPRPIKRMVCTTIQARLGLEPVLARAIWLYLKK